MNFKSNNFLNLLIACFCIFMVLGCQSIYDSGERPRTDTKKPDTTSTSKNPFIGTWKGKAFDGRTDLQMIFTDSDWTLISGSKTIMTRPYKIKGGNSAEVTDESGGVLPITLRLNGDSLSAEMRDGKTTLYRE